MMEKKTMGDGSADEFILCCGGRFGCVPSAPRRRSAWDGRTAFGIFLEFSWQVGSLYQLREGH